MPLNNHVRFIGGASHTFPAFPDDFALFRLFPLHTNRLKPFINPSVTGVQATLAFLVDLKAAAHRIKGHTF